MAGVISAIGAPERAFARVAGVLAAVALAFWSTSAAMVMVWSTSNTYSHGFFIVPAFLWLVWQRREALAALPIQPSRGGLPVLAIVALVWLAGHWMAMALPSQLALVAMVPVVLAALFGVGWVRALLFPLVFLFFAVPFGESLVPVLMDWTADFTVAALKLSGVPVYREGLHFDIPSGKWSVVDSCSGIRYLFACMALSSLYAWTVYRGMVRRLSFIAFAIVIAIVANWLRAYAIVMLGHLSNNQIATGADHLVYGGVFFAVITALVFALGAAWREDSAAESDPGDGIAQPASPLRTSPWPRAAILPAIALVLIALAGTQGPADGVDARTFTASAVAPRAGWQPVGAPPADWRPVLHHPVSVVSQPFVKGDELIGLHIGVFGRSTAESKLTAAMNRFVEPDGLNPSWRLSQQGKAEVRCCADTSAEVRTATLVGRDARLLAWQWYWVDGAITADPVHASLLQLWARLRARSEVSAWITVYTPVGDDAALASQRLQGFVTDMSSSIDLALTLAGAARLQAASGH